MKNENGSHVRLQCSNSRTFCAGSWPLSPRSWIRRRIRALILTFGLFSCWKPVEKIVTAVHKLPAMAHLRYLVQRQCPAMHCAISQARMMSSRRRIGVFGGSGMYEMAGVSVKETQVRVFVMMCNCCTVVCLVCSVPRVLASVYDIICHTNIHPH